MGRPLRYASWLIAFLSREREQCVLMLKWQMPGSDVVSDQFPELDVLIDTECSPEVALDLVERRDEALNCVFHRSSRMSTIAFLL